MQHRVLVIGGGYAGVLTALRVARKGGQRVAVTLVNEQPDFVERVRLAEFMASGKAVRHDLRALLEPSVRFVLGRAQFLDGTQHQVTLVGGQIEPFDSCVLATGSVAEHAAVPGLDAHAYDIATFESAARARERLASLAEGARVVVCGGGLTAIELATELAEVQVNVEIGLVTAGLIGPGLSAKGRAVVRRHLAGHGVALAEHTPITSVDARGVRHAGGRVDANLVVWAGGLRASPLPARFGLEVDRTGRALVDDGLRSLSQPDIFVVGDSAAVGHDPLRMGCVAALPMAVHAADGILRKLAGRSPTPFHFGLSLQCISLGRRSALVQFVHPDDSPSAWTISGRPAAIIKELLCRYAARRPAQERRKHDAAGPRSPRRLAEATEGHG
jgi:NADH:ubiquinone reductase (H+-translocating)